MGVGVDLLLLLLVAHNSVASAFGGATLGVPVPAGEAEKPTPVHDNHIGERMGTHVLLEVHHAPFALLNSSTQVLAALNAGITAGGLTVVGQMVHEFPVMGVSAVLMISESHLSIHTWPENGYAAVDLFTCGAAAPLPCGPHVPIRFSRGRDGGDGQWHCSDSGQSAGGAGDEFPGPEGTKSLWAAVNALISQLDAGGAMLTWLERGMPSNGNGHGHGGGAAAAAAAAGGGGDGGGGGGGGNGASGGGGGGGGGSFGWLGGLDSAEHGGVRPEL